MLHFGKNGQFHQIFSHLVLVWFINCMLLDEYIQFQFLLPNYLFGKIQKLTHPKSCWREISWIFPQKDKNWTKLHVFSYSNRVLRTIDTSAIYNWQTVNVQFYILNDFDIYHIQKEYLPFTTIHSTLISDVYLLGWLNVYINLNTNMVVY